MIESTVLAYQNTNLKSTNNFQTSNTTFSYFLKLVMVAGKPPLGWFGFESYNENSALENFFRFSILKENVPIFLLISFLSKKLDPIRTSAQYICKVKSAR